LNEVDLIPTYKILQTTVFESRFDEIDPIIFECQATAGDSGGAVLSLSSVDGTQLAGIMISVTLEFGQDSYSSIFTNRTIIASLHAYADEIHQNMAVPEPSGAIAPALLFLVLLARRHPSRHPRGQHGARPSAALREAD